MLNRLIEAKKNGTLISEYGYDPEGLRVVKKAHGESVHYVFEGTEPIYEKNVTTEKAKSYVYALGKHLARVDGVIGDTEAEKYWYSTDQAGSVRAVTDDTGMKVWDADYLAFGQQYVKNKIDPSFEEDEFAFTGKGFDTETGLYYYNARWYDSETGRFISEDPVADLNNPNLYSYCANNPISKIDPTGNYGYDAQTGQISFSDGTVIDTKGNVISTPNGGPKSSGGSEALAEEILIREIRVTQLYHRIIGHLRAIY